MGFQGQSLDLGLGFPVGGGGRRPRLGLIEGCFSQRGRCLAEVQQQKAVVVWAKKMVGWNDSLR